MSRIVDGQVYQSYRMPLLKTFGRMNEKSIQALRMHIDLDDTAAVEKIMMKDIPSIIKADINDITAEKITEQYSLDRSSGREMLSLTCKFYVNLSPNVSPKITVDGYTFPMTPNVVTFVNDKFPHSITYDNHPALYLLSGKFEWVTDIHAD
jgi:hypothetical protein